MKSVIYFSIYNQREYIAGDWELLRLWNVTWKPSAEALLYPPLEFSGNKTRNTIMAHTWQEKMLKRVPQVQCRQLLACPVSQPSGGKAILLVSPPPSSESGTCGHCLLSSGIRELLLCGHTFLDSTSKFSLYQRINSNCSF